MTKRDNNNIELEQTLHGYQDGHSLVSSSIKLSTSSRRTMLVLSDMSGSSMTRGFDSYLTCYPLESEGCYVFARTWNAPEMERPGCVWTHSLLVRFADISKIANPRILKACFLRPNSDASAGRTNAYSQSVDVELKIVSLEAIHQHHEAMQILEGLYGNRELPVVFPVPAACAMDDLALDIWAQQWPRLRRSFKFCTGAISFRQLDGVPFDLQFVPQNRYSKIVREFGVERRVEWDEPIYGEDIAWLQIAASDLFRPQGGALRDFFREFAIDTRLTRRAFRPLAEIFLELQNENPSTQEILSKLSTCFQESDGLRLKNALFGTTLDELSGCFFGQIPEHEKLRLLLVSSAPLPSSISAGHVYERACNLWRSDSLRAESLLKDLLNTETNELGKPFLSGLLNSMPPQRVAAFTRKRPGLLSLFVEHEPSLATTSELWGLEREKRREIVAGLERVWGNLSERSRNKIIATLMVYVDGGLLEQFLNVATPSDLESVLKHLATNNGELSSDIRGTLSKFSSHFVKMFESSDTTTDEMTVIEAKQLFTDSFAYFDLDNQHVRLHAERTSDWIFSERAWDETNVTWTFSHFLNAESRGEFTTFVFVDGLSGRGTEPACKVAASFESVHRLLAESRLPITWQKEIESATPKLSLFESWDLCERVRRGTVEFFAKTKRGKNLFFELTGDEELFSQLVSSGLKSKKGKKFLRQQLKEQGYESGSKERHYKNLLILHDLLD